MPASREKKRKTMQAHCGVFRNQQLLTEGVAEVLALEARVGAIAIRDRSRTFNTARVEALELENLIETAKALAASGQKWVPEIVANGGGDNKGGTILDVLLGSMLRDQLTKSNPSGEAPSTDAPPTSLSK